MTTRTPGEQGDIDETDDQRELTGYSGRSTPAGVKNAPMTAVKPADDGFIGASPSVRTAESVLQPR